MEQIKNTELTSQDVVSRNMSVFAKEAPLAMAKDIQGLRAIFEEVRVNQTHFIARRVQLCVRVIFLVK